MKTLTLMKTAPIKALYLSLLFLLLLSCNKQDTGSQPNGDSPAAGEPPSSETDPTKGGEGGTSPPSSEGAGQSGADLTTTSTGGGVKTAEQQVPASDSSDGGEAAAEDLTPTPSAATGGEAATPTFSPGTIFAIRNDSGSAVLKVRTRGQQDGLKEVELSPGSCVKLKAEGFLALEVSYIYQGWMLWSRGNEYTVCSHNSAPACPPPGHYQFKSYGDSLMAPSDEEDEREIRDCLNN